MDTISNRYTTKELHDGALSRVIGQAQFGGGRIGVTHYGKLAAVVISPEDLELLEQLEDAADVAAYDRAKADDDGGRESLADLRGDLGL
jgi:hypothetical protein